MNTETISRNLERFWPLFAILVISCMGIYNAINANTTNKITVRNNSGQLIGYIDGDIVRDRGGRLLGKANNNGTYDASGRKLLDVGMPGYLLCSGGK